MSVPAITPRPWAPHWRVEVGPVSQQGDGILLPHLWKQLELLDLFEVWVEPKHLRIKVNLHTGDIFFNNTLQHKAGLPPDVRPRLIWYRRMRKEMFTQDTTLEIPFECAFYAVGWQATVDGHNVRCGYVIHSDGSVTEGLPPKKEDMDARS